MAKPREKRLRPAVEEFSAGLLHFDLETEMAQLRAEEPWKLSNRNAKTLVKYPDFRIVLTMMKAGIRMKEHSTAGRVSVEVLKGHLRLHLPGQTHELPAGHLLALDRALPHDVEAVQESAFLLSISWPEGKTE